MSTPLHELAADFATHLSQFAPEQREEEAHALLEHVRDILTSIVIDLATEEKEPRND